MSTYRDESSDSDVKIRFAHGTTTLWFVYQGGIMIAVDSRATAGGYIRRFLMVIYYTHKQLWVLFKEDNTSLSSVNSSIRTATYLVKMQFLYVCMYSLEFECAIEFVCEPNIQSRKAPFHHKEFFNGMEYCDYCFKYCFREKKNIYMSKNSRQQ